MRVEPSIATPADTALNENGGDRSLRRCTNRSRKNFDFQIVVYCNPGDEYPQIPSTVINWAFAPRSLMGNAGTIQGAQLPGR